MFCYAQDFFQNLIDVKLIIEAYQNPHNILLIDIFADVEKLDKNRCRVKQELRGKIYIAFLKIEGFKEDRYLWDCDRVLNIFARFGNVKRFYLPW